MADIDGQVEESGADEGATITENALGGKEFKGAVEHPDPLKPQTIPAPEGIPEKFWDPIKGELRTDDLIKSYAHLEKKVGGKADDEGSDEGSDEGADEGADEEDKSKAEDGQDGDEGGDKGEDEDGADEAPAALNGAIEAAQVVYAETGELPDEAREPLRKAGITDQQIDLYLQGVKATEAGLLQAAAAAAGGEDELKAAMAWAATEESGWTDKERLAFNAQMGDPATIKLAVPGLMAAFKAANPGEGKLQNLNTGVNHGDVYTDMEEFGQDLDKADQMRDPVARKKAIAKLRRSRAAGTIKSAPRKSPFQN